MGVLRSMCWLLCLQGEGGKKSEAVATVVAAVDLARVRKPVHAEGDQAGEQEAIEVEMRQQAAATAETQIVTTKKLPAEPPAAVAVASEQRKVQVSQVGGVYRIHIRHDKISNNNGVSPFLIAQ